VLAGPAGTGDADRDDHDDEMAGQPGGSAGPPWRTGDERD
jgi:hypothetical protein